MRQSITLPGLLRLALFLLFSGGSSVLLAQEGCTDPQAVNYDPNAVVNDGSCTYAPTSYQAALVTELDILFKETSGLAFLNGQLWTHTDGGNPDEIYRIDTMTGNLLQSVIVATADNIDWEDFAQDENYLYLGDFGNNNGDRQNLRIFRIKRSDLVSNIVNADLIEFHYEDQTDFTTTPFQTNFDCEAFFVAGDSLHLFTKRWLDYKTYHYVLPKSPGTWEARLVDSLDVQLLLTAADRSEDGHILLLGWNPFTGNSAMWLLFDYPGEQFFAGNKRRINLGFATVNSQPEGLVFRDGTGGWISSENYLNYPQKLLRFETSQWLNGAVDVEEPDLRHPVELYPNPGADHMCISGLGQIRPERIRWYDQYGRTCFETAFPDSDCFSPKIPAGLYWVEILLADHRIILPWVRE